MYDCFFFLLLIQKNNIFLIFIKKKKETDSLVCTVTFKKKAKGRKRYKLFRTLRNKCFKSKKEKIV